MSTRAHPLLVALIVFLSWHGKISAAQPQPQSPAQAASVASQVGSASTGADYQDVDPSQQENVSAPLHVLIAYGVVWLVLFGYVIALWRRQADLQAELQQTAQQGSG